MPAIMLILILSAYFGANFYVFLRLWQILPAATFLRPALLCVGVLLVLSMFVFFVFGKSLSVGLASFFYKVGSSWLFILFFLFLTILIADLLPFTGVYARQTVLHSNIYTFLIICGLTAVVIFSGYINYQNKRQVSFTVDTSVVTGKPLDNPLKIVVVSDLHIGYTIGRKEVSRWIETINGLKPDMVLIPGDLIDNGVRPLYKEDIAGLLRGIKTTYGVFMVPGNHEYITGIDESLEFLANTGIGVLRDSVVNVAGINILGRDDMSNKRRKSLPELVSGIDTAVPLVIMDHQPYSLEEAQAAGAVLQLSGHTHRGQIWPFNWVTDRIYEDSYGLIEKGKTKVYVSSGLGIWGGKFRIGTVSEYVVIEIK